jgi:hypothetical protein
MGKVTYRGPVPKDDPMFSGGVQFFKPYRPAANSEPADGLPDAPDRQNFSNQEKFEEVLGRWHETVGRIRGMVKLAAASKAVDAPAKTMPETLFSDAAVAHFGSQKSLKRPAVKAKAAKKFKPPKIDPEHWYLIHSDTLSDMPGRHEYFTESYRRLSLTQFEYCASGTEFDGEGEVETFEQFDSLGGAAYFVLNLDSAERHWETSAPLAGPRCEGLLAACKKAGWPDLIEALRELEKDYVGEDDE